MIPAFAFDHANTNCGNITNDFAITNYTQILLIVETFRNVAQMNILHDDLILDLRFFLNLDPIVHDLI